MVDFKQDRAIYLQMAERICDEILAGKYHSDDRIPSVREQAIIFEKKHKFIHGFSLLIFDVQNSELCLY